MSTTLESPPHADAPAGAGAENADTSTDRGRGLFLIRALAENVRMHSTARDGSLIHFEKSFA